MIHYSEQAYSFLSIYFLQNANKQHSLGLTDFNGTGGHYTTRIMLYYSIK